jgi:tripartite-type tricarboxylate transporter receptor subunit TctC
MTNLKFPHRRQFLHLAAGAAALPAVSHVAWAQTYPSRPVRVIVPFAPGGQTDAIARLLAQRLSETSGKQFYVENVPGAGGNIGMGRAAHAMADGYTLLVIDQINFAVNPSLYNKVPYDPAKDFDPIAFAASTTQVLTVTPSLPVQSVSDLIRLIKGDPGKYSYASAGVGSPSHLTSELFRVSLGLELVHVPFNGAGPAVSSTIGGHTPIAFSSPASAAALVKEGKLRALAVATKTRLAALPNVPTMAEAGFPDIVCDARLGALAPAGTPKEIVALLSREIATIVMLPDVIERLAALGFVPFATTPEQSAAVIKADGERWVKVIQNASIRAE